MAKSKATPRPHVVIIGGGFGGLYAARHLARQPVEITLIDRQNYHLFQPLLYQVATAALSPGDIAAPIRGVLRRFPNVRVLMGEVEDFDLENSRVVTSSGDYRYDHLIVAAGAVSTYFGNDDWAKHAISLKSIEDALEIRRRLFCAYETAELMPADSDAREAYMTFVVIGGGPTGVEMAGSIAEIATQTLKRDFRSIDTTKSKVILLQSGERILPDYPANLSEYARRALEKIGVEVRTGSRVTDINSDGVFVGETFIPCKTVVWGAGVAASPLGRRMNVQTDRAGRVMTNPDCSVPGFPNVYVVGDLAHFAHRRNEPLPGIATVAIQGGVFAARNIAHDLAGEPREDFVYDDRGKLATIGRNSAVGVAKGIQVKGFLAWFLWLVIHIYFLVGFENRLFVLINWAYSYLSYNRSARLITRATGEAVS